MKKSYRALNVGGAILSSTQLEEYLKKVAADQIIKAKPEKNTYPVPRVKENLNFIAEVYGVLNEDLKNKIPIHPAGEWILDNYYVIEKSAKMIIRDLDYKKYSNLVALANGNDASFARAFVLAKEIISYTDGKIDGDTLQKYLKAYQSKQNLSMEELWTTPLFMQIVIIEKIRSICEKIYLSQIQKRKVEDIVRRLIEMNESKYFYNTSNKLKVKESSESKYPFIEYMSYKLKRYGKKAYNYQEVLEEQVRRAGTTVFECINREHFDIAAKKISIGNCITSINALNRLNFIEIFNEINGVEEVLKQDPSGVYEQMDHKSKEYYRATIEKISKRTKLSEIYISQKCVDLAKKNNELNPESKKSHIGYYLISNGRTELDEALYNKKTKPKHDEKKYLFVVGTSVISAIISCILGWHINIKYNNFFIALIIFIIAIVPIKNILIKIIQYISGKIVKPKLIPKLDLYNGVPKKYSTMVVIPTIINNADKVNEIMHNLEVYYMANKSDNIFFTLLGDCTSEKSEKMDYDEDIIEAGLKLYEALNKKYPTESFPRFNFIYRKRTWSDGENCFLGWERKRGLLNQFNEYILDNSKNPFLCNTCEFNKTKMPKIKYIITLDSDTNLVLNTAFELIGAMAHVLNKPEIDKEKNIVIEGYGIMQPRIGIGLDHAVKSLFTKIYAGSPGMDSYTNAISDFYQDNFKQGIFTGKGIYDLEIFSKVLKSEIPENKVLSHDLLEGCYLNCGLVSDIVLMDGYPTSYSSFKTRLHRWIRGDYQILEWINNRKLGLLSKFKILDNIARSLLEFCVLIILLINLIINSTTIKFVAVFSIIIPYLLDCINKILFKKNGELHQKKYSKEINGYLAFFIKAIIDIALIPDKAYLSINAGIKALYRMIKSKKHLLEWTTAEEAEKKSKDGIIYYYSSMIANVVFGLIFVVQGFYFFNYFNVLIGLIWLSAPIVMNYVSKPIKYKNGYDELTDEEKQYILEIGRRTWNFFKDNLTEKTNFLPPDNYQEDRKKKIVYRTSPTNIGLALLSAIASYDLGFETKEETIGLISKMISSIEKLPKWNGHLYNWYDIKQLSALYPRYVSSVDSGNFVGYLYVLKQFLLENTDQDNLIKSIDNLIENTDFSKLYDDENGLFSIGFNVEENCITDSYYDLLASEARQTSLVAIAKKDIPVKHWKNLGRALTTLNKHNGLISWSGTAFEYLMPTINIKRYPGSLLDESCKFMVMSQIEYAKKLGITWGISEAAFNLKDFEGNYQYKAFGIPWLGLKRGLADEMVVSSYGTILAINDKPKDVVLNLKVLDSLGLYDKYGFYESVDYTPGRVKSGKVCSVVKTYMAHHQGLILLSIDNLINNLVNQKRFFKNTEIEAVDVLLQERMPNDVIITKEKKEKIEKIKYTDYNYYAGRFFNEKQDDINEYNVISNNDYSILIDKHGNGYSKYKERMINRFKITDDYDEGIHFFIKNIYSKSVIIPTELRYGKQHSKYNVEFFPDKNVFSTNEQDLKTELTVVVAPEDVVEIRKLELKNLGNNSSIYEISTVFEPILSTAMQDYSHKAFNNLFISCELVDGIIVVKRKAREQDCKDFYMATTMLTEETLNKDLEFELDKKELYGRNNFEIPELIKDSIPFSNKIKNTTNPIISFRKSINVEPEKNCSLALLISVSENKDEAIKSIKKYINFDAINRAINLSKAQTEAKIQYMEISGENVNIYQRLLSHCINNFQKNLINMDTDPIYKTSELWKFGISGDNYMIVVFVKSIGEIDIVENLIGAYEYYKMQNMPVDLIIVNNEKESYEKFVQESIMNIISNHRILVDGGIGKIFMLNNILKKDENLLKARANLVLYGSNGKISFQLDEIEYEYRKKINKIVYKDDYKNNINNEVVEKFNIDNLVFYNGYGGFSEDGSEYEIVVSKNKKLPLAWSNIMANEKFGTVTTDSMGGYTWYKNSRLNKITAFANDPVQDFPSESIFVRDEEINRTWSITSSPRPDEQEYKVVYGMGYTKYIHLCESISQEATIFVPKEDSLKVCIFNLKNLLPKKRSVKIFYYFKLVLGEDETKTNPYINIKFDNNSIIAKNIIDDDFRTLCFITCTNEIKSFTGSNYEFFGHGTIANPDGIKIDRFSNSNVVNGSNILAICVDVELETLESKTIAFVIGAGNNKDECMQLAEKYSNIENCSKELDSCKKFWQEKCKKIIINTPNDELNILTNGWVIYQTLCSRFFARSGYYQSGGAFGFRDQLQDVISLKYIDTNYMKNQIIKHSKHQFIQGDVLHWWHEDTKRGVRTKFSDDFLWLAYVTADYIEFTGDYSILDIETNYLEGKCLAENESEIYDLFVESEIKESIYNHCIRAIDKACDFGKNGLPKIGSGDWNDGFSNVGTNGIGESVWLGFFLYDILNKYISICELKVDTQRAEKYKIIAKKLEKILNTVAWDGRWYKRAFCDDGSELGTIDNQECRIDSIAQSWSIISGAADNDKKYIAMESFEKFLVDKANGIIKLLDPPFESSDLNPGYIKAYLPGTRENGGQYTHAAIWAIIAEAMLGYGDKAMDFLNMINPIEHSKTKILADKYCVEPYVIAADIYGFGNLTGVGGWTWYTGSSSWYYVCVIKYILGLNICGGVLSLNPCIPQEWKEYSIKYKYGESIYNIKVKKEIVEGNGVKEFYLNGNLLDEKKCTLRDDGSINDIVVII